jgi:hypothetical protein
VKLGSRWNVALSFKRLAFYFRPCFEVFTYFRNCITENSNTVSEYNVTIWLIKYRLATEFKEGV